MFGDNHFLSVGTLFKNESGVLREWMDHYLAEGVDHFYLIDNGSTDDYLDVLAPYIRRGLVTLFAIPDPYIQERVFDYCFLPLRNQMEWLFICDMDEFAYGKTGTIRTFIETIGNEHVNGVMIPWVIFGSSGRIQQPSSVVDGFRKRKRYVQGDTSYVKSIVRMRDVISLGVHYHDIQNWIIIDGRRYSVGNFNPLPLDEDRIRQSELLVNHYQVQSKEWYVNVKMRRGSPCRPSSKRDEEYFIVRDCNDVEDHTLALKRGHGRVP